MNIGIRLDAGKTIGSGHLMRCSSLADALSQYGEITVYFICRNRINIPLNYEVLYIDKQYSTDSNQYVFPSICDELDELKGIIERYQIDCLIVDHYGAKDDYFREVRQVVDTVICIDDSVQREIPVDGIINGNIYGKNANYGEIPLKLIGGEYTLLRKEFQAVSPKRIDKEVHNIYITSGGADPLCFCATMFDLVAKISKERPNLAVHVIAGSDFEDDYVSDLEERGAIIHRNANMRQCMDEADLFLSSAGSTLYELAVCGVPSISFILAEDQNLVANYMWKAGTSLEGGSFNELNKEEILLIIKNVISDYETRKRLSEAGQKTISSAGAENAAKQIFSMLV